MIKLVYGIECQLKDAVKLIGEFSENTGMTPLYFEYNDDKYKYNITDAYKLANGHISESDYIENNKI